MADDRVRGDLANHQASWAWPATARPVPPSNFHITLNFLGNVQDASHSQLEIELDRVSFKPFDLLLSEPGIFRTGGGVAWLAPTRSAHLSALHGLVVDAIGRAGLLGRESGSNWRPHVTLAREAAAVSLPPSPPPIEWRVDAFSLVWSAGGQYRVLRTWRSEGR
jgi:RNA 2',3'-cyclic 3'-phosphodiesterase